MLEANLHKYTDVFWFYCRVGVNIVTMVLKCVFSSAWKAGIEGSKFLLFFALTAFHLVKVSNYNFYAANWRLNANFMYCL